MVNINVQEYINQKYPIDGVCKSGSDEENKGKKREEITVLDLSKGKVGKGLFNDGKTLTGSLKLERFINLQKLTISSHELTNLDINECSNLEELDCQNNKINSLNLSGLLYLSKINCSNNNIKELNLNGCIELSELNCSSNKYLKEVDISNCLKLTIDKIDSNLVYDDKSGRLAKSVPQIFLAEETDTRNVLIIGITGNGKSTLANVLTNTNQFKEESASTSITKNFQAIEFEWEKDDKKVKYRIIDNIGFGDTASLSRDDILFKIGEGIYAAKEGINQVIFVFKGRFASEHVKAFNLFKDFIDETGIAEFTTLVRTNFENFRTRSRREEDQKSLLEQNKEIVETVKSCKGGIVYVDNPPIDDENEEKERNKKIREKSKKVVLDHLAKNCLKVYKLKEWDSIYAMVENYNRKKVQIEQSNSPNKEEELRKAKSETAKEINKGIKASVGVEVPGLPVGLTASVEYNTQKKY